MNQFIKKLSLTLLVILGLSACATTENYEAILSSWVGSSEEQLISRWGAPDSVYNVSENHKLLTYTDSASYTLPGTSTTQIIGNTLKTTTSPAKTINRHCKTTFSVKDGIVKSWTWEGNSCKS